MTQKQVLQTSFCCQGTVPLERHIPMLFKVLIRMIPGVLMRENVTGLAGVRFIALNLVRIYRIHHQRLTNSEFPQPLHLRILRQKPTLLFDGRQPGRASMRAIHRLPLRGTGNEEAADPVRRHTNSWLLPACTRQ